MKFFSVTSSSFRKNPQDYVYCREILNLSVLCTNCFGCCYSEQEMTVKGVEPELQRQSAHQKNKLNKIKATHQAELMVADEREAERYVQMTEELRDQLAKEKEAACARERELARQM